MDQDRHWKNAITTTVLFILWITVWICARNPGSFRQVHQTKPNHAFKVCLDERNVWSFAWTSPMMGSPVCLVDGNECRRLPHAITEANIKNAAPTILTPLTRLPWRLIRQHSCSCVQFRKQNLSGPIEIPWERKTDQKIEKKPVNAFIETLQWTRQTTNLQGTKRRPWINPLGEHEDRVRIKRGKESVWT
jgi:hypothetical protein